MNEYHYTPSELDAIVKCHKELDRGPLVVAMALAAMSGFVVACVLWGGALMMGWI